ncbi:hypothetical protein U14_03336 [Candidatus Moduliflexus flocculans]|uniref:Uncharacterized protein n=1 Tax=Candidatus Moduliflexus flocculans TaxID=1499966 RepID=A0A081BNX2_9BACT|nr:hypothetical protein U14_03336 [Candidatus Moduliflexus flocculans]
MQRLLFLRGLRVEQEQLVGGKIRFAPQQQPFENRFDNLPGIHRHRHGHAERRADGAMFAQQHV